MIRKYRRKSVIVEAVRYTGGNIMEIVGFIGSVREAGNDKATNQMSIKTSEGTIEADVSDYIIKDAKGKVYPCKPDIFDQTYEVIE